MSKSEPILHELFYKIKYLFKTYAFIMIITPGKPNSMHVILLSILKFSI